MHQAIIQILELLKHSAGFDTSGYHRGHIERCVHKCMATAECQSPEAYLSHLQTHTSELNRLLNALTINVSGFFRDPLTFEFIADRILPYLVNCKAGTPGDSLRVWSAACAAGEEAYSVALLIHELLNHLRISLQVSIFATDINQAVLAKARQGVFSLDDVKNVRYGILRRYFVTEGETFRLRSEIKTGVHFSRYNLLDTKRYVPPESVFGDFDLVLCRNVLIYFLPGYQEVIFGKLYRSLTSRGYLVLGESEMPTCAYRSEFELVNDCCRIYRKHD